jgi:hypothetical protein
MPSFLRPLVIAIACLGTFCLASGQEPSSDPAADKTRQEEVSRLAPAKARQLEVLVGDDEPVKAVLLDKPLLRWSNPTAGSVYGEVFLWTVADRPAAIASIFRWYHPFKDGTVEVVSLSPSAVAARENGAVQWDSRSPGIAFQSLDGSSPAAAKGVRLTQMRTLARRFTAQLTDKRSGEAVVRDLRLLNQPIHRYENADQGVLDGAIFAVAEVTDPEVIVLVEAIKGSDSTGWRFALARMNNHELTVRLDDKVVQSFPAIDKPWSNRKATYTLFSFDPATVKLDEPAPQPVKP